MCLFCFVFFFLSNLNVSTFFWYTKFLFKSLQFLELLFPSVYCIMFSLAALKIFSSYLAVSGLIMMWPVVSFKLSFWCSLASVICKYVFHQIWELWLLFLHIFFLSYLFLPLHVGLQFYVRPFEIAPHVLKIVPFVKLSYLSSSMK